MDMLDTNFTMVHIKPQPRKMLSNTLGSKISNPDYSTMDLINNPSKYDKKLLKEKTERRLSALENLKETGQYHTSKYSGFNTIIQ